MERNEEEIMYAYLTLSHPYRAREESTVHTEIPPVGRQVDFMFSILHHTSATQQSYVQRVNEDWIEHG